VDVVTTDDDGPNCRLNVPLQQRIEHDGYGILYFCKQSEFYKVSLPLRRWLKQHVRDYDAVHIHALFSFSSVAAARCARRSGVPYIIRPLGVLNRWGMENRRKLLKALSFRFVERPVLRHAAAMHYTSNAERLEAGQSGATAPAAVIPLGIEMTGFQNLPGPESFLERFPRAKGRTLALFLSRLDVKKGLDLLLPAFAESRKSHPSVMLVIAGDGGQSYVAGLHDRAAQLGLEGDIVWAGFLSGEDKLSAFAAATVFVLPSHSENFGIALVEAMAAGLPCLTTPGVAVSDDIRERDAGLVAAAEAKPLFEAMNRLLDDAALRARLGSNAKRLVQERFSLEAMGVALKTLYENILSRKKG